MSQYNENSIYEKMLENNEMLRHEKKMFQNEENNNILQIINNKLENSYNWNGQERSSKTSQKGKEFFKPIVLTNPKRYQCPICLQISGTAAPLNPNNISLFQHNFDCPNKFKIPQE